MTEDSLRREGLDPHDEDGLLKCLGETTDRHLIWNVTIMLQSVGTAKSVPLLKELMRFPKADIKTSSFGALTAILKDYGQDLYVEALADRKYPEKFSAVHAINEHCDSRAAKNVLERIKKIIKGARRAVYYNGPMSELTTCLQYLDRVDTPEKAVAFDLVRSRAESLEPAEAGWVRENISGVLQ